MKCLKIYRGQLHKKPIEWRDKKINRVKAEKERNSIQHKQEPDNKKYYFIS